MEPGAYNAIFDASGLPSGTYFYQLQAGKLHHHEEAHGLEVGPVYLSPRLPYVVRAVGGGENRSSWGRDANWFLSGLIIRQEHDETHFA
jgi:hypothetical protein